MDWWVDGWMFFTDGCMDVWIDGLMDAWVDEWARWNTGTFLSTEYITYRHLSSTGYIYKLAPFKYRICYIGA